MAVNLYVYGMVDGFTWMGMLPNPDSTRGHWKTLVDAVMVPTKKLLGKDCKDNIEREYNAHKRMDIPVMVNLDNVQTVINISCRVYKNR